MRIEEMYRVLAECGDNAFPFDTGDPVGVPYPPFQEAYARYSLDPALFKRYFSAQTIPEVAVGVRRLLAHFGFIDESGPFDVVLGSGTLHLYELVLRELIKGPGDAVAIPVPTYGLMIPQVKQAGGHPLLIPGKGKHTVEQIFEAIDNHPGRVVALLHLNPNIYGSAYGEEEVSQLCTLCAERVITLIEDLAFFPMGATEDQQPVASALGRDCRVVSLVGIAKPFGLTGARLGVAVTDGEMARRLVRRVETTISFVPRQAQLALAEMLSGDLAPLDSFLVDNNRQYTTNREVILSELKDLEPWLKVDHPPEWGMFCMVDCSELARHLNLRTGFDVFAHLASECGVRSIPAELLGVDRLELRLSYACEPEQIRQGLRAAHPFSG